MAIFIFINTNIYKPVWPSWLHYGTPKVMDCIPGQGTCLGCGFGPWLVSMRGNPSMFLSHIDVSLPLSVSPSLPLSLKSMSMSFGKYKK